ncbi:hypothetical protein E4U54_003051 [Claviceps lovelessii]|nr:hypothetical protein E4U54_003051 [Claviceps lovelessii]
MATSWIPNYVTTLAQEYGPSIIELGDVAAVKAQVTRAAGKRDMDEITAASDVRRL